MPHVMNADAQQGWVGSAEMEVPMGLSGVRLPHEYVWRIAMHGSD